MKFPPEEPTDTLPAYLIWFVPSGSKRRAKEVLEPIAREYISRKAEDNMAVKLRFFIASEENDASEKMRSFAKLPNDILLLTVVDVAHNRVRKSLIIKFEVTMIFNCLHAGACFRSQRGNRRKCQNICL